MDTPVYLHLTIEKKEEEKKIKKKFEEKEFEKKISKKNLSATFQFFSKWDFLSPGEGVSATQAVNGHPCQPISNYRKSKKKKKSKKKLKNKIYKKIF